MSFTVLGDIPDNPIRVFPVRTQWTPSDDRAFVGMSPLFLPADENTPVLVSCVFTWERDYAERIARSWRDHYRDVRVGGPAYETRPTTFVPGRFLKHGCTITSYGCPKQCGWCNVPKIDGALRELPLIHPGWIVQDNNLLACSREHLERVFAMLRDQKRRIFFNGGLDKHYLKPWHRDLFDSISIGELWFACDRGRDIDALRAILPILDGIQLRKRRCYTMIGYDGETLDEAQRRVETVLELGFMPFTQLYQPPTGKQPTIKYSAEWKALNKKWCRPAAYMAQAPQPHPSASEGERSEARHG